MNELQTKAVLAPSTYVQIIAGPGTGKTFTLVHRIIELLKRGTPPTQMVVMTFTNAATQELLTRIKQVIGYTPPLIIGTIHQVCRDLLTQFGGEEFAGFKTISETQNDHIMDHLRFSPSVRKSLRKAIASGDVSSIDVTNVYHVYAVELRKRNCASLDSLFLVILDFMRTNSIIQDTIQAVLVDEFQDTSKVQLDLVLAMCAKCQNLTVVGDPDQSIYKFRDANPRNFSDMVSRVPCEIRYLEQNYRSEQAIIDYATDVIKRCSYRFASDRKLVSQISNYQKLDCIKNKQKKCVQFCNFKNSESEIEGIISAIIELNKCGVKFSEISVLSRTSLPLSRLRYRLLEHNIQPSSLSGSGPGSSKMSKFKPPISVKLFATFLALANGQETKENFKLAKLGSKTSSMRLSRDLVRDIFDSSAPSLQRVKQRSAIDSTAKQFMTVVDGFKSILDRDVKFSDKITELIDFYRQHAPDIIHQKPLITSVGNALSNVNDGDLDLLINILLGIKQDRVDLASIIDTLNCSTIHKAKGLEWPVVILMNAGVDTTRDKMVDELDWDEERRLLYVAMTRAKSCLMVTGWGSYLDPKLVVPDEHVLKSPVSFDTQVLSKCLKRELKEYTIPEIPKAEATQSHLQLDIKNSSSFQKPEPAFKSLTMPLPPKKRGSNGRVSKGPQQSTNILSFFGKK